MNKNLDKLLKLPTLAMCTWEQFNPETVDTQGKFIHRNQVVKMTKRSIVMRTLKGEGIVTLSSTPGWDVYDYVKIEMLPCDTTAWAKADEKMKTWLDQNGKM